MKALTLYLISLWLIVNDRGLSMDIINGSVPKDHANLAKMLCQL